MPNINYQLGDDNIEVVVTVQQNFTECVGPVQRLPWGTDRGATHTDALPKGTNPDDFPSVYLRCEILAQYHAIVNQHREISGDDICREVANQYMKQNHTNTNPYKYEELHCNHFEQQYRYLLNSGLVAAGAIIASGR